MPDGIEFDPESRASQLVMTGAGFHGGGNLDAARMHYMAALLLEPNHPIALQNLSGILFHCEQDAAARSVAQRAINAAPGNPLALANHAAALMHLYDYKQARKELEQVLRALPTADGMWHNYALVLYMTGNIEGGLKALQKSIELSPISPAPIERLRDLGIFTLATGDIALGLERYETRWTQLFKSHAWNIDVPEWKGESLRKKRLLLHYEQGFGDAIMLVRFVKNLQAAGAVVTLAVPPELIQLFSFNFSDVCVIDWKTDYPANFDYHTPMMSALRWLDIQREEISSTPYLRAPAAAPRNYPPKSFRVGICWESGDSNPALRRRRRIVPLELFFPLSELSNLQLVSLQKGPAQKDILALGAESFILDPMSFVKDFADTAAIINELDLVVSVDSAVAHLAGAMGKPVYMLGPYTRCWRWWDEITGAPWYGDNFQIFQQTNTTDWQIPMSLIHYNLENWSGNVRTS